MNCGKTALALWSEAISVPLTHESFVYAQSQRRPVRLLGTSPGESGRDSKKEQNKLKQFRVQSTFKERTIVISDFEHYVIYTMLRKFTELTIRFMFVF